MSKTTIAEYIEYLSKLADEIRYQQKQLEVKEQIYAQGIAELSQKIRNGEIQ